MRADCYHEFKCNLISQYILNIYIFLFELIKSTYLKWKRIENSTKNAKEITIQNSNESYKDYRGWGFNVTKQKQQPRKGKAKQKSWKVKIKANETFFFSSLSLKEMKRNGINTDLKCIKQTMDHLCAHDKHSRMPRQKWRKRRRKPNHIPLPFGI